MPRTMLNLGLTLLVLAACAHQRYGDVYEGPCRVDADCPTGEQCIESRGHLWSRRGEIVGDLVSYACRPPEPAGESTGGSRP